LGVLHELVAARGLGLGAKEETLPRDLDLVTEVFGDIVETNRPDIAPWSKKV
jgi:hypothetical protein